jgi:hypothetical protein
MNPKDVTSAFVRISLIVTNARKRMPFTHFVSIPLTTPEIKTRFLQFKNDVLRFSRGVSKIIQKKKMFSYLRFENILGH